MIKYIDEIPLKGQRVLMRTDFNTPLDDSGNITDDNRIKAALPSIHHAIEAGARLILCSHLGRPKGQRIEKFSLRPVARRLGELIGQEVYLAPDCIGDEVENHVSSMSDGEVQLLENLRYHQGETKNDPGFVEALAKMADVYINDAFAVSHRAHASVTGVPGIVKDCGAGFLIKQELLYFKKAMEKPARPLVAILGGAKISGKLEAINNILNRVDKLIIGGAMANTFLTAQGIDIGKSLTEKDLVDTAMALIDKARDKGIKFYLPVDCIIAKDLDKNAGTRIVPTQEIPDDWMALDIGPATVNLFSETLYNAKTIVWNGPMGAFEFDPFSHGTMALAHAVGSSQALSIVGGGDTDLAIHRAGEVENISYMSTGGGAFLNLLEGKKLPGITALEECSKK
ncbi:MAG: phosphoglycerate kinase [Deltaproteobacteria bacterium]|nr:phosphoglycerate kinase [Deltaproteobacteria bacterium]MBW1932439.1 phosphoglycerate kinase [Deltaproteobacteria bacterium]MBW1937782.1 phosphoglycerate kinase [Deltaproteobacteria bacterium]MBW2080459.1 phosphoglycerate kinase [Deltaproteobacteria bacterium]